MPKGLTKCGTLTAESIMAKLVEIDEIDNKILSKMILDARTGLKEIAQECGISTVSVLKRIRHLKKLGVITGATLYTAIDRIGFSIGATVGMETNLNGEEIVDFFTKNTCLIEPAKGIGEYDLTAVIFAESIEKLNQQVEFARKKFGIKKVSINIWSKPYYCFENIDLKRTNK